MLNHIEKLQEWGILGQTGLSKCILRTVIIIIIIIKHPLLGEGVGGAWSSAQRMQGWVDEISFATTPNK